ncbi:MAG: ANTAR domain-containing response regulator [Phycisphaerales bacterium]
MTLQSAVLPKPLVSPTIAERPANILVADDEHLAATSLVYQLKQLGYRTIGPARDGEHAVELAFSSRPDLAILDVRMTTSTDGIEAASVFLNELMVPALIVSAYADRSQVECATHAGVFGYLVKPVTREQLGPAIAVAWARFREAMTRELETSDLRSRLENRQVIDQAKWLLVERMEVDEGEAMRHMRKLARDQNRTLSQIARNVTGPIALL